MERNREIKIGGICNSQKDGKFLIVNEAYIKKYKGTNIKYYNIKFLDTGYETISHSESIRCGQIKDYLKKCIHSGYLGKGEYGHNHFLYKRWTCMMRRCYLETDKDYHKYGARGIVVDESWHCFQNYVRDVILIEGYDENKAKSRELELDKDIKIKGNKIYSKETCLWVTGIYNNTHHAENQFENYIIINNDTKEVIEINNLSKFCKETDGFNYNGMRKPVNYHTLYKNKWYIHKKSYYDLYLQSQNEEGEINEL